MGLKGFSFETLLLDVRWNDLKMSDVGSSRLKSYTLEEVVVCMTITYIDIQVIVFG